MTANQLAYQSNQEQQRHDVTVETETERHNRETERLADLEREVTNQWQTERNNIQEKLGLLELEYKYADLDRRTQIEEERNGLTRLQVEADSSYKRQMSSIEESRAKADRKYKQDMATIGYMNNSLESLKAEYQRQQWNEANAIAWDANQISRSRILQSGEIAIMQNTLEQAKLAQQDVISLRNYNLQLQQTQLSYYDELLKMARTGKELNLMTSQEVKNYMDSINNTIKTVAPFPW